MATDVHDTTRTTRRALLGGAVALPIIAAVPIATASPATGLSVPIAAALAIAKERRALMDALIEEEDRLELIFFSDDVQMLSEIEREAAATRIGLRRLQRHIQIGWHRWGRAVDHLVRIPAQSVVDVEAKVRAVADCRSPADIYDGAFEAQYLAAIWRDLIHLSAGGVA
jgi:regulator of extracellular matrix RemA (YlzA/DUF370 family)